MFTPTGRRMPYRMTPTARSFRVTGCRRDRPQHSQGVRNAWGSSVRFCHVRFNCSRRYGGGADTAASCAGNPDALGTARTVEIDTTGGPGFGFEHFRQHDFLRRNEVILTFDDGPWPTTPAVLKALADHCVKATFFPIGKHATYYPEILKQVVEAGHTVGSHTWSHRNLARLKPEEAKAEIEKGISAVEFAIGKPATAFFRFPVLQHPPAIVTYLGERNVGIFSTDLDSFDFKMRKAEQVVASVMKKLEKTGKGMILMHDFQKVTPKPCRNS
jgi:peptidoglycan/xylan/chitin deacetylase (PgdA/CDA1 family)